MATTAKGTPYVESTDLVANYPAASLALANHIDDFGGKVLQVVRATDTTARITTSTSFVDASISVTITPQKNDSSILIIWAALQAKDAANDYLRSQITDNSNNPISGAKDSYMGSSNATNLYSMQTLMAYDSPATTSATTYKGRFRSDLGNQVRLLNAQPDGQMYAIEVSA